VRSDGVGSASESRREVIRRTEIALLTGPTLYRSIFSLTNRKHHCRLCGRIVCSLAPTSQAILALTAPTPTLTPSIMPDTRHVNPRTGLPLGTRRETCSLLLVADYRTGRGQEVDENFVGWMQMGNRKNVEVAESSSPSSSSSTTAASARRPDEVQVKGVRTCRECWQTVSRKQKMADRNQVDKFTRLYAVSLGGCEGVHTVEADDGCSLTGPQISRGRDQ
jgi:rabenosyn-5